MSITQAVAELHEALKRKDWFHSVGWNGPVEAPELTLHCWEDPGMTFKGGFNGYPVRVNILRVSPGMVSGKVAYLNVSG